MEVYVKNGEVLKEKPPEGSYAGVVHLPMSEATQLKFFSYALDAYATAKDCFSDPDTTPDVLSVSSDVLMVLNHIAFMSGCMALFESYYEQVKEIKENV